MKPKNPESATHNGKTAKPSTTAAPVAKAKTKLAPPHPAPGRRRPKAASSQPFPVSPVRQSQSGPARRRSRRYAGGQSQSCLDRRRCRCVSDGQSQTTAPAAVAVPWPKPKPLRPAPLTLPRSKAKAAWPAAPAATKAKRATRSGSFEDSADSSGRQSLATPAPQQYGAALQPSARPSPPLSQPSNCPKACGRLVCFLTRGDPYWLYALGHDSASSFRCPTPELARHLVLQVVGRAERRTSVPGSRSHPESRNWLVPYPNAGAKSWTLGSYDTARRWVSLSALRHSVHAAGQLVG